MGRRLDAVAAFGVVFVALLVFALLEDPKPFYYDSGTYWALGDTFVKDGTFSLLNFEDAWRGYLLPLTYHGLAGIADGLGWDPSTVVKVFNAGVFALIATVLAPRLAMVAWPTQSWSVWRRLGLALLLVVFWRSYLAFPLSDFPALAAVLLALVAVARAATPGWALTAGIATAVAINVRPSYILALPVVAGLFALAWWRERGTREARVARRVVCAALMLAGFVAVSLPQSLTTHRHHDLWSFVPGAAADLSGLQFTEGTRLQRYETFVGSGQPGPSMRYEYGPGNRILAERGDETIDGLGEYLGVVASHPLEMGGLFARHVINGLDQRYATPYVETLDTGTQRVPRLLGFVLVFLALLRVAWPAARRSLGPEARWRYPLALLICAAPSVVSAVETRFLLPVYLLAYLLVLAPGWPKPLRAIPSGARLRTGAVVTVAFALYMAVVLYVVGDATDQLRFV